MNKTGALFQPVPKIFIKMEIENVGNDSNFGMNFKSTKNDETYTDGMDSIS